MPLATVTSTKGDMSLSNSTLPFAFARMIISTHLRAYTSMHALAQPTLTTSPSSSSTSSSRPLKYSWCIASSALARLAKGSTAQRNTKGFNLTVQHKTDIAAQDH
eukprot:1161251-Pelagomonas_calceolata.AAC.7